MRKCKSNASQFGVAYFIYYLPDRHGNEWWCWSMTSTVKNAPYFHVNRHLLHTECDIGRAIRIRSMFRIVNFIVRENCANDWKWGLVHCSLNVLQWLKSHKCDSIKSDSVNHLARLFGHGWLCVCACMCAQLYFYVFYQLFNEACWLFTSNETRVVRCVWILY